MPRLVYSLVFSIATLGLAGGLSAAAPDANLARGKAALSQLPLRFEANRGQFDPSVRYAARGGGYDLLFSNQGASLRFGPSKTVDITLPGANPRASIQGLDPMPARTNYFVGSRDNWHTDVSNYARLDRKST